MNLLCWNCRGGGNPWTVRDLATLVASHSPKLVFLCETRQKATKMKRLRNWLGLRGFLDVDSNGMSGGLALYWHENCVVEVLESDERYIDAKIKLEEGGTQWRITCVYGEPRVENRPAMWDKLRRLKSLSDLPWLVLGDFNETQWGFEHFSLSPRPEPQMALFRDMMMSCGLIDLGFKGAPYTYDNMRTGAANVRVRLDRAIATNDWRNLFAFNEVVHLASGSSDHVPVLVRCEPEIYVPVQRHMRYEIFWETDPSPKSDLGSLSSCLKGTMKKLHKWSTCRFGNVVKEINKTRSQLEELMCMNADREEIREVSDKLNSMLYQE